MANELIIKGEEFYKKRDQLKKILVDKDNWLVFYLDEKTGEKWVEEYPNAEYHGGGAPRLRLIEKFPFE